jgi:outer membrane protein OmpA-like peptidoglycan-associated protein
LRSEVHVRTRIGSAMIVVALCCPAVAQKYSPDTAIPAGATGKVLPISGKVLEIRGLSAGVSGKSEALNAALRDLGAKTTSTEIHIDLSSDVLFDFDKADLRPAAAPSLEKLAVVLNSHGNASCLIEGHTDGVGNDRYNQELSERRAASVKSWLLAHRVNNPITTRGWGRTRPVAPNTIKGRDNPEGRQKNRRVEIVIKTG